MRALVVNGSGNSDKSSRIRSCASGSRLSSRSSEALFVHSFSDGTSNKRELASVRPLQG